MNKNSVTSGLALSLRNKVQQQWGWIDPDSIFYAIHQELVEQWNEYIQASMQPSVQKEIYAMLKEVVEPEAMAVETDTDDVLKPYEVVDSLALALSKKIYPLVPNSDMDELYKLFLTSIVNNWDQFIEGVALAYVQAVGYAQLKQQFE